MSATATTTTLAGAAVGFILWALWVHNSHRGDK